MHCRVLHVLHVPHVLHFLHSPWGLFQGGFMSGRNTRFNDLRLMALEGESRHRELRHPATGAPVPQ